MRQPAPSPTPNSRDRYGTPGAHPLPALWVPKLSTLNRLARELAVTPSAVLRDYLPILMRAATERTLLYRNWDTAFSNCVRKDWGNLRRI